MLLPDVRVLRQEETWRLATAAGDVKGRHMRLCRRHDGTCASYERYVRHVARRRGMHAAVSELM